MSRANMGPAFVALVVAITMPLTCLAADPSEARKEAIKWAPVEESMAELVSAGANVVAAFNTNTNTDVGHWGEAYILQKNTIVYRCVRGVWRETPNARDYTLSSKCLKLIKP